MIYFDFFCSFFREIFVTIKGSRWDGRACTTPFKKFLLFLVQKGKFARTKFAFLLALKRQNTRPLQETLTRLSITTKRQNANKVAYEIRVALEGNQLKRLHPKSASPGADRLSFLLKISSNKAVDTPPGRIGSVG